MLLLRRNWQFAFQNGQALLSSLLVERLTLNAVVVSTSWLFSSLLCWPWILNHINTFMWEASHKTQPRTRTPSQMPSMSDSSCTSSCDSSCVMMKKSGESLFRQEQFSDATLVVNGEKWPVHKSILCTRSEYFEKAFTGKFREANTSELIIDGHSTLAVDNVLHYLYTGTGKSSLETSRASLTDGL